MGDSGLDVANPTLCTQTIQWLREDIVIQQSEQIPFWACLGFEVPEDPSVGLLLEHTDLSRNIELCVRFELLTPCFDEIYVVAGTDTGAARVISGISSTYVPAIESSCTVGHGSGPFANNDPVGRASGISR